MSMSRIKRLCFMALSNLFYALSYVLFYLDNQITAGGFGGVATALSYLVPITPGVLTFAMTLPFLIWGAFQRGWLFSVETFISSIMFSVFEDALLWLPTLTHTPLLAAVFGAVSFSIGTIFMLRADVSAGGTDLVAQLIRHHFPHISHAALQFVFNGICVIFGILAFGSLESGLYSIIAIYVSSAMTNMIVNSKEKAYIGYIITKEPPEKLADAIGKELCRGVTLQQGLGMYHRKEENILMVVVKPSEVYRLRTLAGTIDPDAFIVFSLADGVSGGGFQGPKGHYPTVMKGDCHG